MLVFGGLIKNQMIETDNSIPLLGAIPLVGQAFHYKDRSRIRKKLMVFLHPRIVKDQQSSDNLTKESYDDMRNEQLKIMYDDVMTEKVRTILTYPHKDIKRAELVLPEYKPLELPKPFTQPSPYPPRRIVPRHG